MTQSFISVKVIGADKVAKVMGTISKRVKTSQNEVSRSIAIDLQRGIRQRISSRLQRDTGMLHSSVKAKQLRHGTWTTTVGQGIKYAQALELGAKSHPIPNNPLSHTWRTAPLHPGNKPYYFVRDSVVSTKRRANQIASRAIQKAVSS